MAFIIITRDGDALNPKSTEQAGAYLGGLLSNDRKGELNQALGDIANGNGNATGSYEFDGHPVKHASSGDGASSVCLFYYDDNDGNHCVIAMGAHKKVPKGAPPRYTLSDYGQGKHPEFGTGRTI